MQGVPATQKTTADLAASLSHLFVGNLLKGQTVGVIGAGCIVYAYAHMMIEGFKMNLIYYNLYQNFVTAFGQFLKTNGEQPVTWKRAIMEMSSGRLM